ncbi:hypothetical protein SUGI_0909840 [Cryptomeria japonica]|uniref:uncharacterized protein LOC131038881 n=1 Tax=Cryptomeria japonica TaxID=3369 RepID=UPI002414B2F0|nr:uncharacterized protein LOC131038881 [Cryptomeria japonica]GLJ43697.1 hypothetical protein SUGI_0909840 [Cryptomeria japonica]
MQAAAAPPPPPPLPIPVKSLCNEKCTVGCPILDSALNGGIPCGSITELFGECGSGKTQLALQLLLCAQLPISQGGLEASSMYIHSEGYFAYRRLRQLSQTFLSQSKAIQSELYYQCDGSQPEMDSPQKNCLNKSQYMCNQFTRAEPQLDYSGAQDKFGINPINGFIAANQPSGDGLIVGPFGGQSELVQLQADCYNGIQSEVLTNHYIDPQPELGKSLINQPNGLHSKLDDFLIRQLVPAYANLDNDRAQFPVNGGQPKLDHSSINQSCGAHTAGPDQPWMNGYTGSHIGAQLPIHQVFGSQSEVSYDEAEFELGKLPLNCRMVQSKRSITTTKDSINYEANYSSQQGLGKRKDDQSHNAGANEKRICCHNNLEGDQDIEFWGAINSTEWQALDSISKSHAPKPITDVTFNRNNSDSGMLNLDPCDNIFVQGVHTIEELLHFLDQTEVLLSRPLGMPVRLLIIDSVAALFRSDFDNTANDMVKRASLFFQLSSKLKYYAQKFKIAVVVTNQVVDFIDSEGSKGSMNNLQLGNFDSLVSSARRVLPALGLSWAHCINTRLFLSRMEESIYSLDSSCNSFNRTLTGNSSDTAMDACSITGNTRLRRKMQVVFAPHLPSISYDFVIERNGVKGIP